MFKEWFIRKSNALTARRRVKVAPEHLLLLLLPHCMQWSGCAQNVREDIANCKQCGRCRVGDMKALAASMRREVPLAPRPTVTPQQAAQRAREAAVADEVGDVV